MTPDLVVCAGGNARQGLGMVGSPLSIVHNELIPGRMGRKALKQRNIKAG